MKHRFTKLLAICLCVVMLVSTVAMTVSAGELNGGWNKESAKFPVVRDYKWATLTDVVSTQQTAEYFIITAKAGENTEKLFISFPTEGGFRIQSLHDAEIAAGQTTPSAPVAGLWEPSSVKTIDYKTSASGAVVMTGTDGTVLTYEQSGKTFKLWICEKGGKRINYIGSGQISYAYSTLKKGLVVRTAVEMPLVAKEAILMGSQTANNTNQVGDSLSLTVTDTWGGSDYMYMVNPLYHSNRGYSIWFNMPYMGTHDCGEDNPDRMTVTFDSVDTSIKMDIRVWAGTPQENLKKYTDITGRSGVSPTWTYSYWAGASNTVWSNEYDQSYLTSDQYTNVTTVVDELYENYGFYPKAIYIEHQGENTRILNYLNERGIRALDWFHPTGTASTYLPGVSKYPTFDANGKMTSYGHPFPWNTDLLRNKGIYTLSENMGYIDFSNPNALPMVKGILQEQLGMGIKGFMLDFGEWSNTHGTYFNGLTATGEMHNLMAYYYAKTLNEVFTEEHGNDYVLFQRSGTPGSQQFVGNFLGDPPGNIAGHLRTVYMMIGLGAGGWNMYGGDLAMHSYYPSSDVWNRSVPLGVFSPYMRQHGQYRKLPTSDFDALAKKSFGNYYYFRENIVPTVESAAIDANKTSNPIVKGMMMAYPYQLPLANATSQYMFCDDFLVCAVTQTNIHYQQVALPKGSTWYDLYSYKAYDGGQIMDAEAPAGTLPVFVKGGAVKAINLPENMKLGEKMFDNSGDEYQAIPALLVTAPDHERENTIYVKDGESTDYQTYDSHTEVYTSTPGENSTFTITNKEGSPREILLALGVTAATVIVDGVVLDYLDHTPNYMDYEYGYTVDRQGMTTIFCEEGWKEITITKGDAQYVPLQLYPESASAASPVNLLMDGDAKTNYTLPQGKVNLLTLALDELTAIDRVVVKWTAAFYADYDIEYSEDGENWYVLPTEGEYTVVNGCGSVDVIDFDEVEAEYLRFVPMELGDAAGMPAIYELEVYAPSDLAGLRVLPPEEDAGDGIGDETDDWTDEEWEEWEEIIFEEEDVEDTDGESGKKKPQKGVRVITYFPWWAILLIVLGGLAVVGGILLFILLKRKKKQATAAVPEEADESAVDFPEV